MRVVVTGGGEGRQHPTASANVWQTGHRRRQGGGAQQGSARGQARGGEEAAIYSEMGSCQRREAGKRVQIWQPRVQ